MSSSIELPVAFCGSSRGQIVLQVFGKFNIADALRQYGINPCTLLEGRNADAQFPFSDWNKEQLKQVNHLVDHIYSGFVQKVSQHFSERS